MSLLEQPDPSLASGPASALEGVEGGPVGVLICGHGSRNRQAVGEFAQLAEGLRRRLPQLPVEYGYLEFARPILRDGLESLRQQGVKRVLAVPGMPIGSPGMDGAAYGGHRDPYQVFLVQKDGSAKTFNTHA